VRFTYTIVRGEHNVQRGAVIYFANKKMLFVLAFALAYSSIAGSCIDASGMSVGSSGDGGYVLSYVSAQTEDYLGQQAVTVDLELRGDSSFKGNMSVTQREVSPLLCVQ
jgi:hypothetical protein